jgi:hypothetical protein
VWLSLCLTQVQTPFVGIQRLGNLKPPREKVIKAIFPLPSLTFRGVLLFFPFHPSQSPQGHRDCLPRVTLSHSKCGTYIEVTLGIVSLSCFHFGGWFRIFPIYNLCDNKSSLHFFGKINFIRRFISNFSVF